MSAGRELDIIGAIHHLADPTDPTSGDKMVKIWFRQQYL
jgi:hypothetical protein